MTLDGHIMLAAHAMPQGRGYNWPTEDSSGGCFKDLTLNGKTILRAGSGTYCCGVTLEMFWRGWEGYAAEAKVPFMRGISVLQARQLQRAWFCVTGRKGAQEALVPLGLGVAIDPKDARAGDFIQFWRKDGSGHSALLLSLARGKLAYLSTQRSTKGVGSRVEDAPPEIYVTRAAT